VIAVGLVLAILAIIAVAAVGLYWVGARSQQAVAMEQQATVATRAEVEAHRAEAMAQLEQSRVAETPDPRLNFVLEIDREGNAKTGDERIGLDELRAEIAKLKDETSNVFRVHINADPDCPIKHVAPVLEVLDEVGDIDYRIVASENADATTDLDNLAN
jgi:biopolymer transport protein ExbD